MGYPTKTFYFKENKVIFIKIKIINYLPTLN